MRRKFFSLSSSSSTSTMLRYFWPVRLNGFRDRKVQFSSSPGTLPRVSISMSTSMSCTQAESMLSGVLKSTGVTMVMRFFTLSGCSEE